MTPLDAVRTLIVGLLADITLDARLTELASSPDAKWYTLRVEIPDTIAKAFVVPKDLALSALQHPASRRTLSNVLRVEVRMQRSRVAIDKSHEALAGTKPAKVPICPRCVTAIAPAEPVRFEHGGEAVHLVCKAQRQV
jgi:hypothetical protein